MNQESLPTDAGAFSVVVIGELINTISGKTKIDFGENAGTKVALKIFSKPPTDPTFFRTPSTHPKYKESKDDKMDQLVDQYQREKLMYAKFHALSDRPGSDAVVKALAKILIFRFQ